MAIFKFPLARFVGYLGKLNGTASDLRLLRQLRVDYRLGDKDSRIKTLRSPRVQRVHMSPMKFEFGGGRVSASRNLFLPMNQSFFLLLPLFIPARLQPTQWRRWVYVNSVNTRFTPKRSFFFEVDTSNRGINVRRSGGEFNYGFVVFLAG